MKEREVRRNQIFERTLGAILQKLADHPHDADELEQVVNWIALEIDTADVSPRQVMILSNLKTIVEAQKFNERLADLNETVRLADAAGN